MLKNKILGAAAFLALGLSASASAQVIDLFNFPPAGHAVISNGALGTSQVGPDDSIITKYRDLGVQASGSAAALASCSLAGSCSSLVVSNGILSFNNANNIVGVGAIEWDGNSLDTGVTSLLGAPQLDGTFVDLINQVGCPATGCSQFDFSVLSSDQGFNTELRIYNSATVFTTLTVFNPTPTISTENFALLFNAFNACGFADTTISVACTGHAGSLDFTKVDALKVVLNTSGTVAVDLSIGAIEKSGVPEPATLLLMGAGLAAGGFSQRKRRLAA